VGKLLSTFAGLLTLVAPGWAQKPTDADSAALIEKSRQVSLAYARSLPDFVCTEVISRYKLGAVGVNRLGAVPDRPIDKLTVKLSYSQQQEAHQLTLVDGMPTSQTFDSLNIGAKSTGEFGGILRSIFDPASQTSFRWESWKALRRHPVGVYAYQVEENHSNYYLEAGTREDVRRAIVSFHGTMEIDRDTGEVLHLDLVADRIPQELRMIQTATEVDYDGVEVAGNRYLLPVHSQTTLDGKTGSFQNESEFRDYRKFEASSTVDYGPGK
jgi:hypothetical protein